MSEKTLPLNKSAGSSPAEVQPEQANLKQPDAKTLATEVAELKNELQNIKAIIGSVETKPAETKAPQVDYEAKKEKIKSEFKKIEDLVAAKKLSAVQGTSLKNYILQKAFGDVYNKNGGKAPQAPQGEAKKIQENAIDEFEKSNPQFFATEARNALKAYLQQNMDSIAPDELSKIAEIVEILEKGAIDKHEQSKAREKSLKQTNEQAKKRLTSNVLSGNSQKSAAAKIFTREEIGKMSTDEFRKNEAAIMQQLKSGQIV